ncbi:MAG: alpha/beta hydrolase [Peptococcaceae bacterium BRH_c8a]|nr:MAG: alpha/beta hydrolase [Peptococcaceae bacterium BRH_c8a]
MTKTVLMIHGMMGGAWCWDQYKPYFEARGYRCLTPVLRYHDMDPRGTPDPRLGQTGLLDYAADLEEEIRKLDFPPILVGHSMGGLLAQMLGARGLVRALVLLTPAPPSGINALKTSVLRCFDALLIRWRFWEQPFKVSYPKSVYAMSHRLPIDERKIIYRQLVYESGRAAFQIGFWLVDSARASSVDEAKVTCPVLVIGAAEDRITPAAVVRRVADKYKSVSTYHEFANCAHWVLSGPGWERIAGHVCDWLDQQG